MYGLLDYGRTVGPALMLVPVLVFPAAAGNPNDKLCFPKIVWQGTGNNTATAPDITKGYVPTDPGWNGAFTYVFAGGAATPDVIVQGTQDGASPNNLYLGVQVNNLQDWDGYSNLVLAFDPDGTDANKQLLVIQPLPTNACIPGGGVTCPPSTTPPIGPAGQASAPGTILDYYHGYSSTTGWLNHVSSPAWAQVYTGFATGGGSSFQWSLAAKLPIDSTGNNGIAAKSGSCGAGGCTFGFYMNVFTFPNEPQGQPQGSVSAVQFAWPPDAPPIGCAETLTCTFTQPGVLPVATSWGTASIDPTTACGGVSVTSQVGNIYTNNPDKLQLSLTGPNIFSAYVQNNMVDSTGKPLQAQGISATFSIANFGLGNDWGHPGSLPGGSGIGNDPTNPPVAIPTSSAVALTTCASQNNPATAVSNANCVLSTGAWTLNSTEQANYNTPGTLHQCIMVQLSSTPSSTNTIILNSTAIQNMDFVPIAPMMMSRIAQISARGYALPVGKTDQVFDLGVLSRTQLIVQKANEVAQPAATTGGGGTQGQTSEYTWELHGCRHTNTFIYIREKKVELCQSVGGFGFITHAAPGTTGGQWGQSLTGTGLTKVRENVYSIHVPQNGVAQVTTTISAPGGTTTSSTGSCFHKGTSGAALILLGGVLLGGKMAYRKNTARS